MRLIQALSPWKSIASVVAVVVAAFAQSQGDVSDELSYPPDVIGSADMANFSGSGGRCPLKVEFAANATNGNTCSITVAQFMTYSPSAQFFSNISNNVSQSTWTTTSGLTRRFFPFDDFWNWRQTNVSTPSRQWGKWYCEIKVNSTVLKRWEWVVTPDTLNSIGGFASGNSGGSGNLGGVGTGSSPSETTGFWASLFVPSQESLNAFKAKLQELSEWGPLGIYQVIASSAKSQFDGSTANHLNSDLDTPFVIPIQVPKFQAASNPTTEWQFVDLSPWGEYIAFSRLLMSAFLWWSVLRYIWRRVEKKI